MWHFLFYFYRTQVCWNSLRQAIFYSCCFSTSSILTKLWTLTLIGMRQGGFTPLIIFVLDFVSWIFIKNFQTFLEAKIEINWDNLTPCQAHWVLLNLLLGGAKDEHFSYFHSSCQLGLSKALRFWWYTRELKLILHFFLIMLHKIQSSHF